jgi:hypothetical protein
MILKEKLFNVIFDNLWEHKEDRIIPEVEQIADDFAKEVLRTYISDKTLQYKQSQGEYSLDELLLIIKKEKGL